jgi:hypothetical protein
VKREEITAMSRIIVRCLMPLLALCLGLPAMAQEVIIQGKPAKPIEEKSPKPPPEPAPALQDAKLPMYEQELPERRSLRESPWSEIFFVNGTDEPITVGIRTGIYGRNVAVSPRGAALARLPNAGYVLYYLIPKEPKKEVTFREATDSIHSPDGVAQLLRVDRAVRGSPESPGGEPLPEVEKVKKVLTLYQGRSLNLRQDNFVITLSPGRGDALREIKPKEEEKKPQPKKP